MATIMVDLESWKTPHFETSNKFSQYSLMIVFNMWKIKTQICGCEGEIWSRKANLQIL